MKNIKIILVDDHIVLRNGLKLLLESEQNISIVGEASSYSELKTILQQTPTDILLLDLSIPDKHGLEIIKELKDSNVHFKILVFTMHSEEQYIKSAMSAGASGYVEKSALDTELLTAINTVAQGNIYLANCQVKCDTSCKKTSIADFQPRHFRGLELIRNRLCISSISFTRERSVFLG